MVDLGQKKVESFPPFFISKILVCSKLFLVTMNKNMNINLLSIIETLHLKYLNYVIFLFIFTIP